MFHLHPALGFRYNLIKDPVFIDFQFSLMVLKGHVTVVSDAEDFYFSGDVRHHKAKAFANSVLLVHGSRIDPVAVSQRNLKMIHDTCYRAALEQIVRDDADRR